MDLMISVAIISILASIAIPNFKRFLARARQTEAKSNLSSLYLAEKAFYAEWNGYTGDLRDIGAVMAGHPLRYDIGFGAAGFLPAGYTPIASAFCSARTAYNTEVSACAVEPGSVQASAPFSPAAASGSCGAGLTPTATQFRASAVGYLQSGPVVTDVWTIDERNVLCYNQSGF